MPAIARLNRIPHERLKQLRKICGFTQQDLATKIGTSLATIVAIETGTLEMSSSLATRIMLITGVDPHSLREGPELKSIDVPPVTFDKTAYERLSPLWTTAERGETISSFKEGRLNISKQELSMQSAELEGEMRAMCLLTARRNQFHVFRFLFREWTEEITKSFKLNLAAELVAKDHGLSYEEPEWAAKRVRHAKPKSTSASPPPRPSSSDLALVEVDSEASATRRSVDYSKQRQMAAFATSRGMIASPTNPDKSAKKPLQPSASPKHSDAKIESRRAGLQSDAKVSDIQAHKRRSTAHPK